MSVLYLREVTDENLKREAVESQSMTFSLENEDHTLGNSLKCILAQKEEVAFVGYSIPHPTLSEMNIRLQVVGERSALDLLAEGLDDLAALVNHVQETFETQLTNFQDQQNSMADT